MPWPSACRSAWNSLHVPGGAGIPARSSSCRIQRKPRFPRAGSVLALWVVRHDTNGSNSPNNPNPLVGQTAQPAQERNHMFTGTTMRTSTIARTALLVALALVTTGLTQAASRRRDGDNSRKRGEFSIVQLRPAAGMPTGTGDTTTTSDALRKNDA